MTPRVSAARPAAAAPGPDLTGWLLGALGALLGLAVLIRAGAWVSCVLTGRPGPDGGLLPALASLGHPVDPAAGQPLLGPFAHMRGDEHRPDAQRGIDRHARAGKAKRDARLRSRIIKEAGHGDPEIMLGTRVDAPEIELFEIETPLVDVKLRAQHGAIERQRLRAAGRDRAEDHRINHRRAVDVEMPDSRLSRRGLNLRHRGDLVVAGDNAERHDKGAPLRIPRKAQRHAIDIHARRRLFIEIGDIAGFREHIALGDLRRAVGGDLATDAHGQEQ
ncbi:MAG: hypothetical protein J0I40_06350, partial [Cellulomonas sp.]|nr:hypothetical protein [Cellulomonas sp.]